MFSLMRAGQNVSDAKALCGQIKCPDRTNFMGAAAPIAPMVPTPMLYAVVGIQITQKVPEENQISQGGQNVPVTCHACIFKMYS